MKVLRYIIFGFIFLSFGSCQKEEKTIIREDTQSFVKNSPLAGLLSRMSQNPTSADNIIDNSSLVAVQLPVTVVVNGNTITVTTSSDYQLIQNAIDAHSNDDDIVHCVFPMVIEYQNYSSQVVNSYAELHEAIEACGEDDYFDEIDCATLVYPITVNIYDSNNQVANSVAITTNLTMFNFLANLNSSTYVAISYPISAVNSTSQTIVLNSNSELMDFIEDAIDDCNYSGGGGGQPVLSQLLASGSWFIFYCYYEGHNETNYYQGYKFTFNSNGSIIAQKNSTTINGHWDIHDEGGYQRLDLNFDGPDLDDIETNWRVIEYNDNTIKLKEESGNGSDYLTFTKN